MALTPVRIPILKNYFDTRFISTHRNMYKVMIENLNQGKPLGLIRQSGVTFTSSKQNHCAKLGSARNKEHKGSLTKNFWAKYLDLVKNQEDRLEKSFPRTMKVYKVYSIGTKNFFNDLKTYFSVAKRKSSVGIDKLSVEELQILFTLPKDLVKISPILLISAIPFANYVTFPMGYYFPRLLLTSHYWDLQQRLDFAMIAHKARLKHNKPLFRRVQASLHRIEDNELRSSWSSIIAALGSGTHPPLKDIIKCKSLFEVGPYALGTLDRKHVRELLAIHNMSKWTPYRRRKLIGRGVLIKRMDMAIKRDGGVNKLANDTLRWALFFRGLNPVNMGTEDMKKWLDDWITISSAVEKDSISLLLHCPILLAYNHETNWTLLYS